MTEAKPPAPTKAPPGGPWRAAWQLLQPVLAVGALLAAVVALSAWAVVWLLRSPEGTAWLLARVPALEVQGPQGALLSDRFAVERLTVRWDRGQQWVRIDALQAEGLAWRWHPAPGAWLGLDARSLVARRVEVNTGPAGPRPIEMPRSLQMPLRLQVEQAEVAELQIDQLAPMHQVLVRGARLWEPGGREYHADRATFRWDRALVDGSVSLGALPPFTLQAQAALRSADGTEAWGSWTATLHARGPLARFELAATLKGVARPGAEAPQLELDAAITPLQVWALGRIRARTQALDLSALASGAPRTALSGQLELDTRASGGPMDARVELDNAAPGRWSDGRVPVRRLQARLRSPESDRSRLVIEQFEARMAQGTDEAGLVAGRGRWEGSRLQLELQVDDLRPQRLDARAPAMTLGGSLALGLSGLPSPDPAAAPARPVPPRSAEVRGSLEGRLDGNAQAVRLVVDGTADALRVDLRDLRAEAGPARAQLALDARRAGPSAPWQLRSTGTLSDFDPLPWWPGAEGSPWRTGPHRISGNWALDVQLPPISQALSPVAWLQGVAGQGQLRLERSQLAGVPVAALVELSQRPSQAATPYRLQGEVTLGGNRVVLDGQGDPLGEGHADELKLDVQADQLAALAPLARLLPDMVPWQPRSGSLRAGVELHGRWPAMRSAGKAAVKDLQLGTLQARQASADWRFDTGTDDPLMAQVEAQGLVQGGQRLDELKAELRGTWRQHRLELTAALPLAPPALLEVPFGLRPGAGAIAQLRADGQWSGDGKGGGRWAGQVAQLTMGAWGGAGKGALQGPGATWMDARGVRAELLFDAAAGVTEVQAAAGTLRLADAATLRWDEVRVDLRGAQPAWALRADVEPFALAPLLARAQPGMGWSGDLRLGARVDLKVGATIDADLVFERRDGDLRLTEDAGLVPFGLKEMRVAASAHGGIWQLGAALSGQALGEASARLNLRTRPEQRWPDAGTPIEGLIDAQVANLGIWGTWVPPGWRLSGQLSTRATVGGRLGAPDYDGQLRASDVAVRNLLQGVDLRQGEALVRLRGAGAEIERFSLRGGEGEVRLAGRAELGAKPSARIILEAERFRALGRVDRQLVVSGRVALGLADDLVSAEGQVRVDQGLFDLSRSDSPSLDEDVTIRQARPADEAPERAPAAQRTRRTQRVAIELDLGDSLKVRGRGIDTTLGGQVRVGSNGGRPTVHGVVQAAGGTYAAYGQKLEIERGALVFSGDFDNPALDVLALRPNLDTPVGVEIVGSLQRPRVRLYAGSDMTEADKLSWLVLGRASDGLGRADTTLLQRAAVALLAGEGEAPTDTLLRTLGIDELSVRPGSGEVRETVVTLGKQLSRRWYVGYERGVNATTGTWQLIYRIAQRFTLRAQSGLENSLDLIWVWRFEDDPLRMPKSPATPP